MGIYTALSTAVGGLNAQAYALEQISGNIANSQTTAFKRTDVSFQDMVTPSPANRQDAATVRVESRPTNTIQGDVTGNDVSTYMAISGPGYFVVSTKSGEADGRTLFDDTTFYTRRGDFERDAEGYLVNGADAYLQGIPLDENGAPIGGLHVPIQITNDLLAARATTDIDYRANLPSYPLTNDANVADPDSELLDPADFPVTSPDPTTATVGDGIVQASDEDIFLSSSITGGAITAFNTTGGTANVQLRWAKIDNTIGSETWNLFYRSNQSATGTETMWTNVGTDFVFDAAGSMTAPTGDKITISALTIDGQNLGDISLNYGSNGLTQFDDTDGAVQVTELRQNGYSAGKFSSITISDDGNIVVNYSNGQNIEVARIAPVTFLADNKLEKLDGSLFASTADSGEPVVGDAGAIVGSALEASNTEIADEFTKLIVTQQAYSANSRIITTADEMIDEILNIVR